MRQNNWLLGIAGILCLTAGCTGKLASKPDSNMPIKAPTDVAASPDAPQLIARQDFFPSPLVTGSAMIQAEPIPNLIPPTTSSARVTQINSGRIDPFASLGMTPTVIQKPSVVAPVSPVINSAPVTQKSAGLAPLSKPSDFPLPPLLPAAAMLPPIAAGNLPGVTVPGGPPTPPRSAAESLEISGVVQVGGKTSLIIKAADEDTSRYAAVGERVANGKVLIKRVEMGLEPVVILEQAGREIVRSVGSGALVGAL